MVTNEDGERDGERAEREGLIAAVRLSKVGLLLNEQSFMGAIKCVCRHVCMRVGVFLILSETVLSLLCQPL